jgi:hypothetical protein
MKLAAALLVLLAVPAAARAAPAPELAPFAFLAGSCWHADFPGGRMADTHCFSWVYGGHFLRDRHVVTGLPEPYRGETLYRWDDAAGAIRYDYYSSDGAHSGGLARGDGAAIRFTEAVDGGGHDGATAIRSSWTRADDGYVALAETPDGTGWRTLWRMHFTRAGPAPAD